MTSREPPAAEGRPPLLRVVRGDPTPEELAALVAVVAARASAADPGRPAVRRSEWSAHHRRLRRPHRHGPGGWRASAWPG